MALSAALAACTAGASTDTAPDPAGNESPIAPSSAAASSGQGEVYSAASFAQPFEVTAVDWMGGTPTVEQSNLLTWVNDDDSLGVRVLAPVSLYPPEATEAVPVPDDYESYLRTLGDHGAELTDWRDGEVGGRPATFVTVVVPDGALDGALGCPAEGMTAEDCFGPQQAADLRLVVVDGEQPVLFWLRSDIASVPAARDAAEVEFDRFLDGVVFEANG